MEFSFYFLRWCLLSLARILYCSSLLTKEHQLRDIIGLNAVSTESSSTPGAVIFLSPNSSTSARSETGDTGLEQEALFALAQTMENKDPSSLFLHFNGHDLVTSMPTLFAGLQDAQWSDSWTMVLEQIGKQSSKMTSTVADFLVFEAYPDGLESALTKVCESTYAPGKCQILKGDVLRSARNFERPKRQAGDTTTAAPPHPAAASSILPVIPYPAAFQLLFWTTLAIALTVYGVSYAMWNMDPGRDSIIYRMTSAQKYKKDK